ncbi:uncharacterized protein LOC120083916 [Benincasa hispida]|uniref:uncharacterized protein LOC120083916 n=1 Tax=Benincasa hispida TaxID=102211 RepID=UPI001901E857|nr:uncharacterized protein LOC120083916 [Benincasa hispida]
MVVNMPAQVGQMLALSGANFKTWKEDIELFLGLMDLDLALRMDRPISTPDNPNDTKIKKWDRSNRMSLMIIKRSIPRVYQNLIVESMNAKVFLKELEQSFAKNENEEARDLLTKLVVMRYTGKGNIREYIIEMSSLATKLKALKLEICEDLLVHFVLMSLPTQYTQLKVCYNTQKHKWTLNELISFCVAEEERMQQEESESDNLESTSKGKKKKREHDDI